VKPEQDIATSYAYDLAQRLQDIGHDLVGTSADQSLGFGYNAASQIVTRTATNDAYASNTAYNVNRGYSVNGLNQYIAAGPSSFTYDANGNLTWDGSTAYVYDAENRLVSASGGKTAALVYDPLGRLFQTSGGAAGVTQFLYDGDALIGEYDAAGTMNRRYVHGSNAVADDPLIWYEYPVGGYRRNLIADQQGSIIAASDMYGNPVAINAYDAWGIPNAANQGRFGYTGQAWLPELGMWYYKARIYSPTLGRFLQTDPVGYKGGLNLYDYVGSDPLNKSDPTGLLPPEGSQQEQTMFDGMRDTARQISNQVHQVVGTVNDFQRNYRDMRRANTVGADKYFHCKANCEAAARGSTAEKVATKIGDIREISDHRIKGDPLAASIADQRANQIGRVGANATRESRQTPAPISRSEAENICRATCKMFRPNGLDEKKY
jgi:RHS repeat-associated protein